MHLSGPMQCSGARADYSFQMPHGKRLLSGSLMERARPGNKETPLWGVGPEMLSPGGLSYLSFPLAVLSSKKTGIVDKPDLSEQKP